MSRKLLPLNPRQMVGLADGNSFYCSCEESMQPWLHGKPISWPRTTTAVR